jgi:VanZ family protein
MKLLHSIANPKVYISLFSLLLIITPFLMLQNYLQEFVGGLSHAKLIIGGQKIPYVFIIGASILGYLLIRLWRQITIYRLAGLVFMIIMWVFIGQHSTDYYFNHSFYELQHNWHYIAYGIYASLMYRLSLQLDMTAEKAILRTFISALVISSFDEMIQVFISSRIFDICDIGKDIWGTCIGMVFVHFVVNEGAIVKSGWKFRQKKLRDYLHSPFSLLFQIVVFTYIFLFTGSQLTEFSYLPMALVWIILIYLIFLNIFHFSQFHKVRTGLIVLCILVVSAVIELNFIDKGKQVLWAKNGLVLYHWIPVPYFDVLIKSNGAIRPVDKKSFFNGRDIQFISKLAEDVLIIGSGYKGQGGHGFPEYQTSQFIYNTRTQKPLQVMILPTTEAAKRYQELKAKGIKAICILHNS